MPPPDRSPGVLSIVATPIGNLGDITLRALECLRGVDLIACEDTRHSARLLQHHGITKVPRVSLHEHNEARRSEELVEKLLGGASVALISDAGTPTISDPGQRLLQRCIARGIPHQVIPGPSAVIAALAGSGLPTDAFAYRGFLPVKKGARERELRAALDREETTVFFETPHRIVSTLEILSSIAPERLVCLARELTKKFEEFHRDTAEALFRRCAAKPPKGEMVLLISGSKLPKWIQGPPAGGHED